ETTVVNVKNSAWLIGEVSFDPFILGSRDMEVLEARNEGGSQIAGFHGKAIVRDNSIVEAERVVIAPNPPNTCSKSVGDSRR
ncbi:hypothetical protein A2U01_0047198, partial [Trifolium medium]|nr:hypothetical protein [Trifolium medium]